MARTSYTRSNYNDVRLGIYQDETTVCRYTCRSTRVHYPDSKPSLKQPSVCIHLAPLGYIILIPSPHVRAWNQDMYPSGVICIPTDGCFSEGLESG
jgi:hypothetical protein